MIGMKMDGPPANECRLFLKIIRGLLQPAPSDSVEGDRNSLPKASNPIHRPMKSKFDQPMKSLFVRVALCGALSFSGASWNSAQGAMVERGGGRGSPPMRIHHNAAPRPMAHPNAVARREAPRPQQNAVKVAPGVAPRIAPNVAPRIAGVRRPVFIRNLEYVAHLRHELFSHRWSFVYAGNLNHAPKSIRFLQDGTVETDLKGEKWYWEAMDGRRVSLRALADPSQPGITLEFNEGYTNFQYALPNQTVAVQGAELNAIAEGPAPASSTDSAPTTLEQALLNYHWNWTDATGKSEAGVRFDRNKSFQVAGRTSFWNVTGPRTVHVEFANGNQTDLLFDTTFSVYTDGNQISGAREVADSNVAAAGMR